MKYAATQKYLMSKFDTLEDYPFGPDVAVYKVRGKMFATLSAKSNSDPKVAGMNLKCEPEIAVALRDTFASVLPGYHMNKKHWNTVLLDGSVPAQEIKRMIDMSYVLVVKKLTKVVRTQLEIQHGQEDLYHIAESVFSI